MPTVPITSVSLQAGASTPAQGPNSVLTSNPAAGQLVQAGRATEQAGISALRIASALQDNLDNARTKEQMTRLGDFATESLEGPGGYFQLAGAAATGEARAQALQTVQSKMSTLEKGLDNEVQREMFRRASNRAFVDLKGRVYQHEARQIQVYGAAQSKAMGMQAESAAIGAYLHGASTPVSGPQGPISADESEQGADVPVAAGAALANEAAPDAPGSSYRLHLNTAIEQANEWSDNEGLPADSAVRQVRVLQAQTRVHDSVVKGLLGQGRDSAARDYLTKYGEAMDPVARANAQSLVRRTTAAGRGRRLGLSLVAQMDQTAAPKKATGEGRRVYRADIFGGAHLESSLHEIDRQQFDGKIDTAEAQAARTTVVELHKRREAVYLDNSRDALEDAVSVMSADKLAHPDSADFPPELYARLERFGQLNSARKFSGDGARWTTQYREYAGLLQLNDVGGLTGMSELQFFDRFRGVLDDRHYAQGLSMLGDANETRTVKPPKSVMTDTQRLKNTARKLDIDIDDDHDFSVFVEDVDRGWQEWAGARLASGEEVGSEQFQEYLDLMYLGKKRSQMSGVDRTTTRTQRSDNFMFDELRRKSGIELADAGEFEVDSVELEGKDVPVLTHPERVYMIRGQEQRITNVPADLQAFYRNQLIQAGMLPTEERIMLLWDQDFQPATGQTRDQAKRQPKNRARQISDLIDFLDNRKR